VCEFPPLPFFFRAHQCFKGGRGPKERGFWRKKRRRKGGIVSNVHFSFPPTFREKEKRKKEEKY